MINEKSVLLKLGFWREEYRCWRKLQLGFTLVEMLIVIFIVAILAAVAIANFGAARQKAKIDLVADSLVSVIKQQQSAAKSKARCFGLKFSASAPAGGGGGLCGNDGCNVAGADGRVNLIDANYVAVGNGNNRADYCEDSTIKLQPMPEMEDFIVQNLKIDDAVVPAVKIYFKPPFATAVFDGNATDGAGAINHVLTIAVVNALRNEVRTLQFDSATGRGEIIRN